MLGLVKDWEKPKGSGCLHSPLVQDAEVLVMAQRKAPKRVKASV